MEDSIPTWKEYAQERARKSEVCPACLGLRVTKRDVPIGHKDFGRVFDCPVCTQGRISKYLKANSGLESWLAFAKHDDYIHTRERDVQYNATMEVIRRGSGWLTLWGGYGTSKTYCLAFALNEFIKDRRQGVYTTAGKLLDNLRDSYGDDGPGYSYAFDQWSGCYALAVDEVDSYHRTSWSGDKFRQMLDRRYLLKDESVTLFASNVQPGGPGWPDELGWLASRMSEFPIIEAAGGDVRPLIKEEDYT